jgi:hypothetical protein
MGKREEENSLTAPQRAGRRKEQEKRYRGRSSISQ